MPRVRDQPPGLPPNHAGRIQRGWRLFLVSPGRLRAVAATVCIQAAWRGATSRSHTAALLQRARQQRQLLAELYAALRDKHLHQARVVAARLTDLGCCADADQLVADLERQGAAAGQALSQAAAQGDAAQFCAAAAAAAQYSDLEGQLADAASAFQRRVAAAAQAVSEALAGGSAAAGTPPLMLVWTFASVVVSQAMLWLCRGADLPAEGGGIGGGASGG